MVEPLFVILPLAAVGFVALFVWAYLRDKKRREALARVASELGLAYERDASEDLVGRLQAFPLMNQGFGRRAFNVLRGAYRSHEVRLFEYEYKTRTHDGKRSRTQTHRFAVAVAWLPARFARVRVVPETFGHKLWDALGGDDIDFESDEFSRRFWVKADDRRTAYDLLHPRAMELLLQDGWKQWEILGDIVLSWDPRRHAPEQCRAILDRLVAFVDLVPSHVAAAGGRTP